ncbi:MAE_28990/MAE_18760 family HEPN-like nuclease [Pseudomonas aeruginosa]
MDCYTNFRESITEVLLIAASAEDSLADRSPQGRLQGNAMARAGLVLLCGYLEGYIKDIVEEFIESLNDEKVGVNELPPYLFCSIIEPLAASRKKSPGSTILEDFRSSVINNQAQKLDSKRLSKTGGNPTVDTIESIFLNIGIPQIIDKLSISDYGVTSTYTQENQADHLRSEIEEALKESTGTESAVVLESILSVINKKWTPTTKRRKVGYVSGIEELLKRRNRIAHGENKDQITPAELFDAIAMVDSLTNSINVLVDSLLDGLTNVKPATVLTV